MSCLSDNKGNSGSITPQSKAGQKIGLCVKVTRFGVGAHNLEVAGSSPAPATEVNLQPLGLKTVKVNQCFFQVKSAEGLSAR
jgi:hypothetical protein